MAHAPRESDSRLPCCRIRARRDVEPGPVPMSNPAHSGVGFEPAPASDPDSLRRWTHLRPASDPCLSGAGFEARPGVGPASVPEPNACPPRYRTRTRSGAGPTFARRRSRAVPAPGSNAGSLRNRLPDREPSDGHVQFEASPGAANPHVPRSSPTCAAYTAASLASKAVIPTAASASRPAGRRAALSSAVRMRRLGAGPDARREGHRRGRGPGGGQHHVEVRGAPRGARPARAPRPRALPPSAVSAPAWLSTARRDGQTHRIRHRVRADSTRRGGARAGWRPRDRREPPCR